MSFYLTNWQHMSWGYAKGKQIKVQLSQYFYKFVATRRNIEIVITKTYPQSGTANKVIHLVRLWPSSQTSNKTEKFCQGQTP
jgi:hypothetical protein